MSELDVHLAAAYLKRVSLSSRGRAAGVGEACTRPRPRGGRGLDEQVHGF